MSGIRFGADNGSRTRLCGLGSDHSTDKLCPHIYLIRVDVVLPAILSPSPLNVLMFATINTTCLTRLFTCIRTFQLYLIRSSDVSHVQLWVITWPAIISSRLKHSASRLFPFRSLWLYNNIYFLFCQVLMTFFAKQITYLQVVQTNI